ncbi:TetR/AcrR family transcriptional regulator [Labrenzia sp. CE80]|uniref:TetR/AcrR family transcriptional regulator n=1 Tax=Labrenzia sp. CE80 TaxID=1788986 RepID=UPI00129A46F8|nr:TetR/AcrR family transcriptional regulator [Labrenzia sp. CE80]
MSSTREAKRNLLRERLIDAAEIELNEKGLKGLKARDVTKRAGCALGALYNAVDDLDMLILEVNSRTLTHIGETLEVAVPNPDAPAETILQSLAEAYVDYAIKHRNHWLALFEHRMPDDRDIPDRHKQNHAMLIGVISPALAKLRPDLTADQLTMRARTTFAAVHGVVYLALQGQFVGVPMPALKSEVAALVSTMARSSAAASTV